MIHDTITRLVIPIVETYDSFQPKVRVSDDGSLIYGFGFRFDDEGQPVSLSTKHISRTAASESLRHRLNRLIDQIVPMVPSTVTPYQMAVMVDYAYDMGIEKLRSSGLIYAINAQNTEAARQRLMMSIYTRKNNRTIPSKTRESRRRMGCKLWDRPNDKKE